MKKEEMFSANDFCFSHSIEISFIHSLEESGLIEVIVSGGILCIPVRQIKHLEKLVRFHHDMDINLEGIEAISYLLERVHEMQQEVLILNSKLSMYENE